MAGKFELGRTARRTRQEIWDDILDDERSYHEAMLFIVNKRGKLVNFKLNQPQQENEDFYVRCLKAGIRILDLELKYRQFGNTRYWAGKTHTRIISRPNHKAHIVAHRDKRVKEVLSYQRFLINNLPRAMRPTLEVDNNDKIKLLEQQSQVTCSSATDGDAIRGDTYLSMILTEAAYFAQKGGNLKDLLTSALAAVPDVPDALIVAETTGNGTLEDFHHIFMSVWSGENKIWTARFFEWFKNLEYEKPFHKHWEESDDAPECTWEKIRAIRDNCKTCHQLRMEFKSIVLDKDEDLRERMKRHKLTYEQINFYWFRLMELDGDRLKCQQEYPCTVMEAFIASGTPIFDVQLLERLKGYQKPGTLYEVPMDAIQFKDLCKNSQLRRGFEPYLEIWKQPNPRKRYAIVADSSEGKEKSNPSATYVFELESMAVVAEMHGLIEPDVLGDYCARLGNMYFCALAAPERQNHGITVINKLIELNYANMYQKHLLTPSGWEETQTIGWDTNSQTKPWIVALARKLMNAYRDNLEMLAEMIPSAHLADDLMRFTRGKLQVMRAIAGAEDDRPMAYFIGLGVCHQEMGMGLSDNYDVPAAKDKRILGPDGKPIGKKLPEANLKHSEHKRARADFLSGAREPASWCPEDKDYDVEGDYDDEVLTPEDTVFGEECQVIGDFDFTED